MSKVKQGQGKGGGKPAPATLPPTIMTEKLSTYAFGTVVAGAMMVAIAAWMGGSLASIDERINEGLDSMADATGLTVKTISIEGLNPRGKADVLNALQAEDGEFELHEGLNMFRADPYLIKARVDEVDSVGHVRVLRQWPNEIWILAENRTPIALWRSEGEWGVIDQLGVVMASESIQDHNALLRIEGESGNIAAPQLLAQFENYPEIGDRVVASVRVGARRWDLQLKSGIEISMPEDALFEQAANAIMELHAGTGVLDGDATRLDARDPERFAIGVKSDLADADSPVKGA